MKGKGQNAGRDPGSSGAGLSEAGGYLFAAPRAALLLFVSAMFLLAHGLHFLNADPVSMLITESEASVSKDGIFRAILFFRAYNAVVALLFFSSLSALGRLAADKYFGASGFLSRAAVYAAAGVAGSLLLYGKLSLLWLIFILLCALAAAAVGLRMELEAVSAGLPVPSLRALLPGFIEAVSPRTALSLGRGTAGRAGLAFYALSSALCLADLCANGWPGLSIIKAAPARLAQGDFYGMEADPAAGQVSACKILDRQLLIFGLKDGGLRKTAAIDTSVELQEIKANPRRKEIYNFDREQRALLVLDPETLLVKKRAVYGGYGPGGSARVAYDNDGNSIVAILEHGPMYVANMATLRLRAVLRGIDYNEFILFDPDAKVYLLSFFRGRNTMLAVSADGKFRKELPAGRFQGGMAISEKRHEFYLALPLQGKVLVYDSRTLEPKGVVRSGFGVRGLACDDANEVLLAASMCSGSIDVIGLGDGRLRSRVPLGYYLREIALDPSGRTAFVSSISDGVVKFSY